MNTPPPIRSRTANRQMLIVDSRRLAWLGVELMANPDSSNLFDSETTMDYNFCWCFCQSVFDESLLIDEAV